MRQWVFLFAVGLVFPAPGQQAGGAEAPFVLTWVEGRCSHCSLSWDLASIEATTVSEAWAIGESWPPPGGQGLGERIVLHSKNGGHAWAEVRQTRQHAVPPAVSFLDASRGWMAYARPLGDGVVLQTRDGGRSWNSASGTYPVFPLFLDESHWIGVEAGHFLETRDAGRTWRKTPIPHLGDSAVIRSLAPGVVWIADLADDGFRLFRTTDGGEIWTESRTATPPKPTHFRDVFFRDQNCGWLITWHSMEGSYVFATTDGGKSWVPEPDRSLQGSGRWATCVRFLSAKLGFIFEDVDPPGQDARREGKVVSRSVLAYTTDGGAHWRKLALSNQVRGCQVFKGDLLCCARGESSGLMVLKVHPKQPKVNPDAVIRSR